MNDQKKHVKRYVTLNMLVESRACQLQTLIFHDAFGERVLVTEHICSVYANIFNWFWAAENLLSPKALDYFRDTVFDLKEIYGKDSRMTYNKEVAIVFCRAYSLDV